MRGPGGVSPQNSCHESKDARNPRREAKADPHTARRTPLVRLFPHHPNVLQRTSKSALACARPGHPSTTHSKHQGRTTLSKTRPLSTLAPRCHTLLVLWSEAQSFSVKERCRVVGLLNGVRRASVGRPNVWAMEFFVGKTPDRFKCMRVYEPRNGQKQDHIFN